METGNEVVVLRNSSELVADLAGWMLRDRANNTYDLSGSIPAVEDRHVQMLVFSMPLNNSGDRIELLDQNGSVVHVVEYSRSDVGEGEFIQFGQ